MDENFVPKIQLTKDGTVGRCYWDLPIITPSQSTIPAMCGWLEENISLFDSALNKFARGEVLSFGDSNRIKAHCCEQAMRTLRDVREALLALSR